MEKHIIKNIYLNLQDEISRQIFEKRLMYSFTDDYNFLNQIIKSLLKEIKADELMEKASQVRGQLIAYGAGHDLQLLQRLYPDFSAMCLCDRDSYKQQNGWNGYRVISPELLLADYRDDYVLITTTEYHKEIYEFLKKNGIKEEYIINVGRAIREMYELQYFDGSLMKVAEDEIFVDGGCYDGNTSLLFSKWCGGNYRKIYAFEPDSLNYEKCKILKKQIRGMELVHKGLWSKASVLHFVEDGSYGSRFVGENAVGTAEVSVVRSWRH